MLIGIAVYLSLAVVLFALGWHAKLRDDLRIAAGEPLLPFYCWEILASVGVVAIVFGARYKTGTDYLMYLSQYFSICKGGGFARPEGMEPGFEWVTKTLAAMRCHFTVYFGFWAALQAVLLYFGLRRHKFLIPWAAAVLVLGPHSINWFSFMRQWVVAMAMVAILPLVLNRRFVPYALCVCLLTLFHYSALLLLLLYFLPFERLASLSRKWLLAAYGGAFLLGVYPFWIAAFKPLLAWLPTVGYGRYCEMLTAVVDGGFHILNIGPLRLIALLMPIVAIWYYPLVRQSRPADTLLPIVFALTVVVACYDVLMTNTVHFLVRPADLLYPCMAVMLAYVYDYLWRERRLVELAVTLLPVVSYVCINVVKSEFYPSPIGECVNYHILHFCV